MLFCTREPTLFFNALPLTVLLLSVLTAERLGVGASLKFRDALGADVVCLVFLNGTQLPDRKHSIVCCWGDERQKAHKADNSTTKSAIAQVMMMMTTMTTMVMMMMMMMMMMTSTMTMMMAMMRKMMIELSVIISP